jgi:hypothetical protein
VSDPAADRPQIHREECGDCHGWPADNHVRCSWIGKDGFHELWHLPECPKYLIERIMLEDGARRVKVQDAWAKESFPAAHERLRAAAAALDADGAAAPFVAALTELVQAQADTTGFVVLHEWVEILDRHFPPEQPNPMPQ